MREIVRMSMCTRVDVRASVSVSAYARWFVALVCTLLCALVKHGNIKFQSKKFRMIQVKNELISFI